MAVISAASVSASDVQAAINAASDGDTVQMPPGTATWSSPVQLTKGIALLGSGIGVTTIVDGIPHRVMDDPMLGVNVNLGQTYRLGHFTLQHLTGDLTWNGSIRHSGTCQALRIDHIHYQGIHLAFNFFGHLYGVIDHCTFDMPNTNYNAMRVEHPNWNGGLYGDGSWADDPYFGTDKFIFVEDCIFNGTRSGFVLDTAQDIMAGGRMVFRYNTVNDMYFQGHNGVLRDRGGRCAEVYNNIFTCSGGDQSPAPNCIFWDSGSLLVHHNTAINYVNLIRLVNDRSDGSLGYFGQADGTNPWDQNTDALGYACFDQPGRGKGDLLIGDTPTPAWPNQQAEPIYEWENTWSVPPQWTGGKFSPTHAVMQENRDYFANTPKPGYVPFIYPHPLVADSPMPPSPSAWTMAALSVNGTEVANGPIGTELNYALAVPRNQKAKTYVIRVNYR